MSGYEKTSRFSEKYSVQEPIITYVSETQAEYDVGDYHGWNYIKPEDIGNYRSSNSKIILENIFLPKVKSLNPFLSEDEAKEVLNQLENVRPDVEGNFTVWQFLNGLKSVYISKEKRNRNVRVIDTEEIDNNDFHVTKEYEFTNGLRTIRQDIVFFVNGIPVIFIETKAPHVSQAMDDAIDQVKRYHRECPELLAVEQAFVITHLIKFLYGATWNVSYKNLYDWKEDNKESFEKLVKSFFNRERIIKLITEYTLFTRKDDTLQKVILRPHQMRAVEKILERAKDKDKRRGLIWHTQGSGKTYTMIVAAKKMIEDPSLENPTVILLVDRNELESQLFNNIKSVGIEDVEVAESKEHLRKLLRADKRGLIVSMIHKFEGMEANINCRENIFVLIDEAHRTTSGDLANYLMGALPNATYIGFTGTPIDKTASGKGTFVIFGRDDPPKGYLDKYSISESISDGTTVPLHYCLAPNELMIDKELLNKEFLALKETEGISDIDELNRILDRAVNLKNAIKSTNRIKKVAKYIADHYVSFVEPLGYKAFVVAVDREACAIYKKELDNYLPPEYSRVVFSKNHNDPEFMKIYHLSDEEEKVVRKNFQDPEKLPKILIVTNKLLTGFDAPVLYCMYLDKPMRDHVLLQTIARVNRPYEDKNGRKKTAGLIVDFIGIFSELKEALSFDSSDIEGVVDDIELLKKRFELLINMELEDLRKLKSFFSRLNDVKQEDKKIDLVLSHFLNEHEREAFYKFYRELSNIYDIVAPDPFLRPYLEKMDMLTRIYKILREAYDNRSRIDGEISKKVSELLQKNVYQSDIRDSLDIYEIDKETLEKLREQNTPETLQVFNMAKSISNFVEKESSSLPILRSIGERVEKLMMSFKKKQKNTQETLDELRNIIKELNEIKDERISTGLNGEALSIYWILKTEGVSEPLPIVTQLSRIMEEYPHWKESSAHEREVMKKMIGVLLKCELSKDSALEIANKILDSFKGVNYEQGRV